MKRIFLASPHMSDENYEMEYIKDAFEKNWIAPLGENVNEFENGVKDYTKAGETLALVSGTSALHLALMLENIGEGDIVFCSSLTFSASANPIKYVGATPVFIDSELDTWNMSPEALTRAFAKYPKAKAVIVVNLYGIPAKLNELRKIAHKNNAVLIEDAAESLGTKYKGKYTGTYGDYGVFSFNGNKIITTSGGGMLTINTENAREKKERGLFLATQAREKERYYQHKEIGYNFRMSNIVAGIGRGQLRVLDKRIKQKQQIFKLYERSLSDIEAITMMPMDEYNNCWLSCIQIDKNSPVKPYDIMIKLESENIESRPIWKPMHLQPVFSGCEYFDNGSLSEDLFNNGVCLPSDTNMNEDDVNMVANIIRELWK